MKAAVLVPAVAGTTAGQGVDGQVRPARRALWVLGVDHVRRTWHERVGRRKGWTNNLPNEA